MCVIFRILKYLRGEKKTSTQVWGVFLVSQSKNVSFLYMKLIEKLFTWHNIKINRAAAEQLVAWAYHLIPLNTDTDTGLMSSSD